MVYQYSKIYPVVSNIVYFILSIYAFGAGVKPWVCHVSPKNKLNLQLFTTVLVIFSILALLAGSFSIDYHLKTPSWEANPSAKHNEGYHESLHLDMGFASTLFIYGFVALIVYMVYFKNVKGVLLNGNFWMGVFFSIASIISYIGANKFDTDSHNECDDEQLGCFKNYQTIYNMYHAAWHLLSGFSGFFWVLVICDMNKNLFK